MSMSALLVGLLLAQSLLAAPATALPAVPQLSGHRVYAMPPADDVLYFLHQVDMLSAPECQRVIDDSEAHAATHGGWTTARHVAYPTTDLPVADVPSLNAWLRPVIDERLTPLVAASMGLVTSVIGFRDLFVARYDHDKQYRLHPHRDGSTLSFNVLLSDPRDFDGGGTYVHWLGYSLGMGSGQGSLQRGQALIHASKLMHEGFPITRGRRYILVGFVTLSDGVLNTDFVHRDSYLNPPTTTRDNEMVKMAWRPEVKAALWEKVGARWQELAARQAQTAAAYAERAVGLKLAERHALADALSHELEKRGTVKPREWDRTPAYFLERLLRWDAANRVAAHNVTFADLAALRGDEWLEFGMTPAFGAELMRSLRAQPVPAADDEVGFDWPQPRHYRREDADPRGELRVAEALQAAKAWAAPRPAPGLTFLPPDMQRVTWADSVAWLVDPFPTDFNFSIPERKISGDVRVCARVGSPVLLDVLDIHFGFCTDGALTPGSAPFRFEVPLNATTNGWWASPTKVRVEAALVDAQEGFGLKCDTCRSAATLEVHKLDDADA